ncbi:MAG TPA: tRNA epoxyqueuosine(34) reductase QueG [Candidatus Acidoferrales bacterium]|nr:tRNA epoxyqueuosine(34) reductase QueG [Candidatus Acidoferrales bacterium]
MYLPADAKPRILAHARQLGFDLVGIASPQPFGREERVFKERRDRGYLERWHYDDRTIEAACRPERALPGVRSIICTATSYYADATPHDPNAPGLRGAISSYAWGLDYHKVIGRWLTSLAQFIESEFPGARCLKCADTGPMVDRAAAVRAGIGWFGKNGNVLTKQFGSYVFLAELLTTLDLEPDRPLQTNCGQCVACIARCPTDAIGPDGAVDSRRCLSDITQMKGPIPREYRPALGNRLWGCDDCQTACPVNQRNAAATHAEFAPSAGTGIAMDLPSVLLMSRAQFRAWFGSSAMAWRGKAVLQRNAAVALGNSQDVRAVPALAQALRDRKPVVRGHAAWALGQLGGGDAERALLELLDAEPDAWVRDEAEHALARMHGQASAAAMSQATASPSA